MSCNLFNSTNEDAVKIEVVEQYYQKNNIPKIIMSQKAITKMKIYVDEVDSEIGWIGLVYKTRENEFYVYDTMLPEQKVTGVTTDLDESALCAIAEKLIEEGKYDDYNNTRLWGHSHVNMGVTPSGTDEQTFEELHNNCEYFIRLIANKKGDVNIDLVDKTTGLIYKKLPFTVDYDDEIKSIVKEYNDIYEKMQALGEVLTDKANQLEEKVDEFKKGLEEDIKKEISDKIKRPYTRSAYSGCSSPYSVYAANKKANTLSYDEEIDMYDGYYGASTYKKK